MDCKLRREISHTWKQCHTWATRCLNVARASRPYVFPECGTGVPPVCLAPKDHGETPVLLRQSELACPLHSTRTRGTGVPPVCLSGMCGTGVSPVCSRGMWHGRLARVSRAKGYGRDAGVFSRKKPRARRPCHARVERGKSYMRKATTILIAVICFWGVSAWGSKRPAPTSPPPRTVEQAPLDQSAIHLAIATVDPMLAPTTHYHVGEQVIVTLAMTNTSTQPGYVCDSSDLYQDLPILKKNGHLLPYTKWQTYLLGNVQTDQTCRHDDLPERILLKTNEPTVVDFLTVVDDSQYPTGAQSWYDSLTPGNYELTMQRRLGCCDGPMIESNKISFEVTP